MYTQCSHCKAVFRVTMKELTAAQGLLRCGECDTIFDAMKALTTTMPDQSLSLEEGAKIHPRQEWQAPSSSKRFSWLPWPRQQHQDAYARHANQLQRAKERSTPSRWLLNISLAALSVIMLLQIAYAARHWLIQQPVIGNIVENVCQSVDCRLLPKRDLKKLNMISRNVFSHPNSPNVLIIKASVQNEASFVQPYPYIEISFLNNASEIVALRRFRPEEYLDNVADNGLMPMNSPRELSVYIKDPGPDAIRFQFRFL